MRLRILFFFLVPALVELLGLYSEDGAPLGGQLTVGRPALLLLSVVAACADQVSNAKKGRKRPSCLVLALICIFLYVTQVGLLIHLRLGAARSESREATPSAAVSFEQQPASPLLREDAAPSAAPSQKHPEAKAYKDTLLAKSGRVPPKIAAAAAEESLALAGFGGTHFGGRFLNMSHGPLRTVSIVLPCAEERQNALNTVDRFCFRTPEDQLAEIIVVDDGSDPPLKELFAQDKRRLDQHPRCKVKILRHEVTTGLMAAKQTGGKAATGDVVAFFDCHCSPKLGWEVEILKQVSENPRRMVVPGITDLDMDTFDEKKDSAVNAKCYLTFDADFKWFDDSSDFIPTISGGLVAMGRQWFNMTGGFDEEMHGWGGENLDQSLRAWLCGGEITRAKSSRIAHMWRTGDPRTGSRYRIRAKPTNNRGRVAAAWFDAFLPVYRGGKVNTEEVKNFDAVKQRLGCRPFSYFIYRFRRIYIEGGIIATTVFGLREKASGLCLAQSGNGLKARKCAKDDKTQQLQRGNVEPKTGKCCSGIRKYGGNDCLDYVDNNGPHWYSCEVSGNNLNQRYQITKEGWIRHQDSNCLVVNAKAQKLKEVNCIELAGGAGVFEEINAFPSKEYEIYQAEVQKHRYLEVLPDLPDN